MRGLAMWDNDANDVVLTITTRYRTQADPSPMDNRHRQESEMNSSRFEISR